MRALVGILLLTGVAHADDRKEEFKQRDAARAALAAAVNAGDAAAFAGLVGDALTTADLWLDTPACRKRFSDATVTKADVPAFVACLAPLGMNAQTLLVRYGPDVIVQLGWAYAGGKTTLTSMRGDGMTSSKAYPGVWLDAFEKHRTAGDRAIVFDDKARAEIADSDAGGAIFEVCVDAKGAVASIVPRMVSPTGPTATALKAAAKRWKFDPFLVRGKPATACALETQKI